MVMSYYYISEVFGSISTAFVEDSGQYIIFGFSLFVFCLLSFMAGPINGFVSGIVAEFLYQLSFYNQLYLEWCIIIGLLGLLNGMYKYKPTKYQNAMKIYYTFLAALTSSIIASFLIAGFQIALYGSFNQLEDIIINYGFRFLIQSLISYVFIVPIILVLYDRALGTKERFLYHILLTHHPISASDHTFYFKFGRTKINFCSRCSGVIIGGLVALFFTHLTINIFNITFPAELAVLLCIVFPIPGLIDWGTQRLLYRKSTTESRLLTGFIIGNALHFLSFATKYFVLMMFIVTLYFSIFFILVYFGNKKELKRLEKESNRFSSEGREDFIE